MQFSVTALLLAATSCTSVFAKPLPLDFNDIERRWSEGQSEVQIHPALDIREATPAWSVARAAEAEAEAFESTTDERSMSERSMRSQKRGTASVASLKAFVEDFMRGKGEANFIGWGAEDEDEAPVLKPRKGMRYRWTA